MIASFLGIISVEAAPYLFAVGEMPEDRAGFRPDPGEVNERLHDAVDVLDAMLGRAGAGGLHCRPSGTPCRPGVVLAKDPGAAMRYAIIDVRSYAAAARLRDWLVEPRSPLTRAIRRSISDRLVELELELFGLHPDDEELVREIEEGRR